MSVTLRRYRRRMGVGWHEMKYGLAVDRKTNENVLFKNGKEIQRFPRGSCILKFSWPTQSVLLKRRTRASLLSKPLKTTGKRTFVIDYSQPGSLLREVNKKGDIVVKTVPNMTIGPFVIQAFADK